MKSFVIVFSIYFVAMAILRLSAAARLAFVSKDRESGHWLFAVVEALLPAAVGLVTVMSPGGKDKIYETILLAALAAVFVVRAVRRIGNAKLSGGDRF